MRDVASDFVPTREKPSRIKPPVFRLAAHINLTRSTNYYHIGADYKMMYLQDAGVRALLFFAESVMMVSSINVFVLCFNSASRWT